MGDTITIPAMYIGTPDATLVVRADVYGDSYAMALQDPEGRVIASASGFRPGACTDFGSGHETETAQTFGAFLSAALEDPEFAEKWDVIADDASEWTDALVLMGDEES